MARVGVLQAKNGCASFSASAVPTALSRAAALGQTFVINSHTNARRGTVNETVYRTDGETRQGDRPLSENQVRAWARAALNCGPGVSPVVPVQTGLAAPSPPPSAEAPMQIPAVDNRVKGAGLTMMAPPAPNLSLGGIFGGLGGLAKRIIPGGIDDAIIDFVGDKLAPGAPGSSPLAPGIGPCPLGSVNIGGTCRSLGPGVNAGPASGGTPATGPTTSPGPNWQSVKVGNRTAFVPQVNQVQVRDCPPGYKINDKDGLCYHSTRHGSSRKRSTKRRTHSHSHSHSHRSRSKKCWAKYKGKCYSRAQARAGFAGPRNKAKAR